MQIQFGKMNELLMCACVQVLNVEECYRYIKTAHVLSGELVQIWGICTRRAGKLYKARSWLYRTKILQVNTKYSLEALAENYTMHFEILCTVIYSQFFV